MSRCKRCNGLKKVYKKGGIYTLKNTGGQHVDCPLCLGTGDMPNLEDKINELKKKAVSDDRKEKISKKDSKESGVKKVRKRRTKKEN